MARISDTVIEIESRHCDEQLLKVRIAIEKENPIVPPARRKTTILIVEDDAALRTFYRSVLTLEGYAVITAEDGVDALKRLEEQPVGAVILDLGLPRLRGEDVGREMAAHHTARNIPIVVVTGCDTANLNLDDFACVLTKPVTAEALIRAVRNCLRHA